MNTIRTRGRRLAAGLALAALVLAGTVHLARRPAAAQETPALASLSFSPGPMSIARGQTSRHVFHLHGNGSVRGDGSVRGGAACRLTLEDVRGEVIAEADFALPPGGAVTADLAVLGDGSVRFNGRLVRGVQVERGNPLEIIPCVRVLSLPRGAALTATAQCVDHLEGNPRGPVALGKTTYILPYAELGAHDGHSER